MFVFGAFNVHHKDWITYSYGTDRVGKPLSSIFCLKWPAVLYLFLLMLVFVLQWLSLNWKFWSSYCLSFHWSSVKFKEEYFVSSHTLWLLLCWLERWNQTLDLALKSPRFKKLTNSVKSILAVGVSRFNSKLFANASGLSFH